MYVLFSEYAGDDFETQTGLSLDDVIAQLTTKYPRLPLILSLSLLGRAIMKLLKNKEPLFRPVLGANPPKQVLTG